MELNCNDPKNIGWFLDTMIHHALDENNQTSEGIEFFQKADTREVCLRYTPPANANALPKEWLFPPSLVVAPNTQDIIDAVQKATQELLEEKGKVKRPKWTVLDIHE